MWSPLWLGVRAARCRKVCFLVPVVCTFVIFAVFGKDAYLGDAFPATATLFVLYLASSTLVTYAMNGGDLPAGHGGPLRLRVPRQLGYKSVKYITRLTVTDSLKGFGKGMGSSAAERGYSWYSGI